MCVISRLALLLYLFIHCIAASNCKHYRTKVYFRFLCINKVIIIIIIRFIGEIPLDLPLVLRQSNPRTPILLLHKQEQEGAEKLVADFAARKQSRLLRVVLSGTGTAEERTARKLIHKAMAEVR